MSQALSSAGHKTRIRHVSSTRLGANKPHKRAPAAVEGEILPASFSWLSAKDVRPRAGTKRKPTSTIGDWPLFLLLLVVFLRTRPRLRIVSYKKRYTSLCSTKLALKNVFLCIKHLFPCIEYFIDLLCCSRRQLFCLVRVTGIRK